jgi:hypothetical protein
MQEHKNYCLVKIQMKKKMFEQNEDVLINWFVKSFKLKCTKTNMAFLLLGKFIEYYKTMKCRTTWI